MPFRTASTVTAAVLLVLLAGPAKAEVRVTMHDGLVTIDAKEATVRQILTEWAKVGQTTIVHGDEVGGGPLTLQLTDVPEAQALDIILRSVSGYLAAPRPMVMANASRFDRIVVIPTPAPAPTRASAAPAPPPSFPQPRPAFPPPPDDQATDAPPPAPPLNQPRGPVFNTFPQPVTPQDGGAAQAPPAAPVPSAMPSAPGGVSTPGMIVQPAGQPGQIAAPSPG